MSGRKRRRRQGPSSAQLREASVVEEVAEAPELLRWSTAASPGPESRVRRKLLDAAMSGFVIGNTAARPLLSRDEAKALLASASSSSSSSSSSSTDPLSTSWLRLCYIGVGDVRNPLATLAELGRGGSRRGTQTPSSSSSSSLLLPRVALELNDMSPVTLARDVVLLLLATRELPSSPRSPDTSLESALDVFVAVWCDARLSADHTETLRGTLNYLLTGSPWTRTTSTTKHPIALTFGTKVGL